MYDKTKVSKVVDSVGGTTQYEYDSMGRISKEKDSSGNILRSFSYDTYGQLVRENNAELDKTFVFEYNNNGGITLRSRSMLTRPAVPLQARQLKRQTPTIVPIPTD